MIRGNKMKLKKILSGVGLAVLGTTMFAGTAVADDKNIREEIYELLRKTDGQHYSEKIGSFQVELDIGPVYLQLSASNEDGWLQLIDVNEGDSGLDIKLKKLDYGFVSNRPRLRGNQLSDWEKVFDKFLYKMKPGLKKQVEDKERNQNLLIDKLKEAAE